MKERAINMFDLVEQYAIQPSSTFNNYFPETFVEHGEPSIDIFGEYKGQRVIGSFHSSINRVEFEGEFHSPSRAALNAIHSLGGEGRVSVNGWTFWKYLDGEGNIHELDQIRD